MILTKKSLITGKDNTMVLSITEEEYVQGMIRRSNGELIQNVFPNMSTLEREFILTGSTEDEWNDFTEE